MAVHTYWYFIQVLLRLPGFFSDLRMFDETRVKTSLMHMRPSINWDIEYWTVQRLSVKPLNFLYVMTYNLFLGCLHQWFLHILKHDRHRFYVNFKTPTPKPVKSHVNPASDDDKSSIAFATIDSDMMYRCTSDARWRCNYANCQKCSDEWFEFVIGFALGR